MSKVSTFRKLGVAARIAGQQAGRNRTLSAIMSAVNATAGSFGHVLHLLWLEVTGLIFLVMALGFAGAAFKEYGKFQAHQVGPARLTIAITCTVAFAWFGLSSFWRVHRKSQRS